MKKNSFFSFLEKNFDIDPKEVIKQHRNIQKIAWEQVLLLAIMVRQKVFTSNYENPKHGHDFYARMRLIDSALMLRDRYISDANKTSTLDYDEFIVFILRKLDNGCGIIELTTVLIQKAEEIPKDVEHNIFESMLYQIENCNITFSKLETIWGTNEQPLFEYSHYAMYIALYNPLTLFTPLLGIKQIEQDNDFQSKFIDFLKNLIDSCYVFFQKSPRNIRSASKDINDQQSLQAFIIEYSDIIDSSIIKEKFLGQLMQELTDSVSISFKTTIFQNNDSAKYSSQIAKSMIEKMCKPNNSNGELVLTLNENILEALLQLGQIDAVMSEIRAVVLGKQESPVKAKSRVYYNSRPNENSIVFISLSNWFEQCKTTLFRKFEDIPRLVASIIVHDVKWRQGEIGAPLHSKSKKLLSKDIALYSAKTIYYCLYRNIPIKDFNNDVGFDDAPSLEVCLERAEIKLNNRIEKQIESSRYLSQPLTFYSRKTDLEETTIPEMPPTLDTCFYNNDFMKVWANNSIEKTINNVKKLPPFEKKSKRFIDVQTLTSQQKAYGTEQEIYYPLGTGFPLPLWCPLNKFNNQ